jgi:hypothetical protein
VVKGVFDEEFLAEASRYCHLKQCGEGLDERSYETLSGHRWSPGLLTKQGWTKHDYAGLMQQVMSSSPSLFLCASELYGTSRLCTNLYEYKYSFGRPDLNTSNMFEFFHAGKDIIVPFSDVLVDCNYAELLWADQAGLPVDDLVYQYVCPVS